ncbi:MAG: Beta-lactamase class C-like and penicillin binding proteins (PBPs) superfamily [uncultured Sphingosinicella sp.]|uniref:Beta-lactamase class C-like and penicillin binding proteins (PBPs) superfamily n=1 Tax=uncultured Sphingosinicella sp. TaxID=478748 RepID=A0A6J4TY99_9SPHN|nr:serine hydrolase [uncultured Sphingosinicella sp.]CAA9535670.1 MAG: Beta-lactamase class C-like and penicillin binding proteins (PBPs) superfamily [uncultured Sphingosinicella sp.]
MIDAAYAPASAAILDGQIPGATLGIVTADGRRSFRHSGMAALFPEVEALTEEHWFDLASVSKVIATTSIILTLAEQGRIDLDRPLTDAIPDLRQYDVAGAPERTLTFRDCLAHRTFLPAVEPIYTYGDDPARLRAFVLQREWRHVPPAYSDINFILLGIAIERLTGEPLSAWPLGAGVSYGPPPGPAVATEACTWRGRVMKGEVHDENAWALGGAPGHAGLFGTVAGVLDFAQGLLDGSGASEATLKAIRTPVHAHRTCGWEIRFDGWHGGDACSPETIGHTGFTGTGLWVDFDRGLAWTLLTNRVHPTRHRETSIMDLRRATGDAVVKAFDAL